MTVPILFSGSSNLALAQEMVHLLGLPLGRLDIDLFPDKEIYVEVLENVYQRDVCVVQSIALNPNFYLMELLIILDALKRAAARSITAIIPYYGYARQDRLNKPGVAITARLIADMLTMAGAGRVLTLDLHSEQIEGFFDIPIEQLLSRELLIPYCASLQLKETVVVAPDQGGIKIASAYAKELGVSLALIDKERIDAFQVKFRLFVGDVQDKTVIIPDDMCSTAGTLVSAAEVCAQLGACKIIAVVSHGLFISQALDHLQKSPIEKLIVTNSIAFSEEAKKHSKIEVISIAPLFANWIKQHF